MPKNGFLTPKAIANRIKAKGLQKLRWYCQMCQKQCRDENGFKCHTTSESHQRQLLLFAENPNKYIDQFSQEFLDDFMQLLKRRFGTKRVHANQVYQEYIADRNHLHMNATEWETLTDFVKWLGREGHCTVDETEKGWFVSYVDRDPETIQRQESLKKQEKMKLDDEERNAKFFQRQMERDKEKSRPLPDTVYTELKKSEDEKIAFSMKSGEKPKKSVIDLKQNPLISATSRSGLSIKSDEKLKKSVIDVKQNPPVSDTSKSGHSNVPKKSNEVKKRKFALDEIMEQEKNNLEKKNRKDYWLAPGIVVKVLSKRVGEEFYKKKAVVTEVEDKYYAILKAIDSGKKTVAHQKDLETVIPAVGRKVMVLNGAYRCCEAILSEVNFETFSVKVKISLGTFKGKILESVKYEDVSKLDVQT